jgi:hypothetical protein
MTAFAYLAGVGPLPRNFASRPWTPKAMCGSTLSAFAPASHAFRYLGQ